MPKLIGRKIKSFGGILSIFSIPNYKILMFLLFLSGISTGLTTPFLSLFITQEVKMTTAYLGYFMAISAVSSIIVSTIIGKISDYRPGRKKILLITSLAGVIGYYLFSIARSYYLLLLISISLGAISSAITPQLFAYARQFLSEIKFNNFSLAISILRVFPSIAWMVVPAMGAIILESQGFKGLFASVAVSYTIATIVIAVSLRRNTIELVHPYQTGKGKFLFKSNVLALLTAFVILQTINTVSVTNLPLLVKNTLNGTNSDVGLAFSVSAGLEILFMIWFGFLGTKMSKPFLIKIGIISALLYYVGLSFSVRIWQIFFIQIFNACFVAAYMGLGISYFQDLIPNECGTATTLFYNTVRLGSIFGGLITGGVGETFGLRTVFLVCSGLAFIALILFEVGRTFKLLNHIPKRRVQRLLKN